MRIGIDARQIVDEKSGRISGVHQFTSEIISALQRVSNDELVLFTNEAVPLKLRRIPIIGNHFAFAHAIHRARLDLFFSPAGLLPIGLRTPSVVFVHDLIILKHPEWFPDSVSQQLFTLRHVLPRTIRHAKLVIVPSESVKRDLVEAFPEARTKVRVIAEGVAPRDRSAYPSVREKRYVLSLSTLEPRKNLVSAIDAFDQLLKMRPELASTMQLVIAGKLGWGFEPVLKAIAEMNLRWREHADQVVCYLGPISEEEKWPLYAHAEMFLSASFAEGFGLPAFEAMSVGTPVISTAVGAIPDLASKVVLIIPSHDPAVIARAMLDLIDDPSRRKALGQSGQALAKSLTWDATVSRLLEFMHG